MRNPDQDHFTDAPPHKPQSIRECIAAGIFDLPEKTEDAPPKKKKSGTLHELYITFKKVSNPHMLAFGYCHMKYSQGTILPEHNAGHAPLTSINEGKNRNPYLLRVETLVGQTLAFRQNAAANAKASELPQNKRGDVKAGDKLVIYTTDPYLLEMRELSDSDSDAATAMEAFNLYAQNLEQIDICPPERNSRHLWKAENRMLRHINRTQMYKHHKNSRNYRPNSGNGRHLG